jgi:hypothetical protein
VEPDGPRSARRAARLQRLLGSPQRPTWVAEWHALDRWGLDPGGRTDRLLARGYRVEATRRRPPDLPPPMSAWIVFPTHDEADNIEPLVAAVRLAMSRVGGRCADRR